MLDLDRLEREAGPLDGWSAGAVYALLRYGRKHCGDWDEHDDGGIPSEGCAALIMALPELIARARRADELELFLFNEVMPRYAEMCEALNLGESVVVVAARKLLEGASR